MVYGTLNARGPYCCRDLKDKPIALTTEYTCCLQKTIHLCNHILETLLSSVWEFLNMGPYGTMDLTGPVESLVGYPAHLRPNFPHEPTTESYKTPNLPWGLRFEGPMMRLHRSPWPTQ